MAGNLCDAPASDEGAEVDDVHAESATDSPALAAVVPPRVVLAEAAHVEQELRTDVAHGTQGAGGHDVACGPGGLGEAELVVDDCDLFRPLGCLRHDARGLLRANRSRLVREQVLPRPQDRDGMLRMKEGRRDYGYEVDLGATTDGVNGIEGMGYTEA
eukprot:CAMPEP_0175618840 /NCGR_PEP_ID=MMETSP0096-20121207/67104_1 /TAXON_ID=311494 /ORGANISM="Alexandrium monilatum, Strain CCMP3105" /LENGTH=157 /DNA_ID=CAMNT_0016924045 /DNA_START=343 /DNA_END=816 /DNA_ORIENTATION=+